MQTKVKNLKYIVQFFDESGVCEVFFETEHEAQKAEEKHAGFAFRSKRSTQTE
jgi:hypothetical protein